MIYLFHGDPFFVEQKYKHRRSEFASKFWAENVFIFDVKNRNTQDITNTIWWAGLFADKKMVIIQGLPQDTTTKLNESTKENLNHFYDYFVANINAIPQDNLIIFTTTNPDKKTKRTKYFLEWSNANIKITEFKADKKSITNFISEQSHSQISWEDAELLTQLCNENMFSISNELKKITNYLSSKENIKVTSSLIREIVSSDASVDVRSFLDGMVIENNPKSIEKFIDFSRQDNNEFQFLWLLYWSIGWIINLIDSREHNITDAWSLAKNSKLPPFTVSRYSWKKDKLVSKKDDFHRIYHSLVDMDYKLKTGLMPSEGFWNEINWILLHNW